MVALFTGEAGASIFANAMTYLTELWTIATGLLALGFSNPVTGVPLACALGGAAIGLVYMITRAFRGNI